jgi:FkbH-like protein
MLKQNRNELDYFELTRKAKSMPASAGQRLKLAILADVSTQHLTPVLRALFASNGVDVDIYAAGFDTIQQQALDPGSGLYAFQPQIVVILQSVMNLKSRFYELDGDRDDFSQTQAQAIEGVWRSIQSRLPVPIIQSTFVVPHERTSGNFTAKTRNNLQSAIGDLNREICRRAQGLASVYINDVDHLAAWAGRAQFVDERLWALAKSLCALDHLPDVAQNLVDIALACSGRVIKCVVLDLDNTLWGGVVGDDGLEGIALGELDETGAFRAFQLYLRELWRRGILLAVCSKNDESVARRVFRQHPAMVLREEHIAVFVANWQDKATNIARIRESLNIGYDAMVFLDDNPFERNLVRRLLHQVIVPELPEDPTLYVRAVSELNLFETASLSGVDTQRTAMYQDQQRREQEVKRFASLEDYLQSLETMVLLRPFEPQSLERIAQLIQRSNQFNLTTRRHSESQCQAFMLDPDCFTFTITVRDRFGDFGLVNVVVLRKGQEALEIDTFLMSCRVLQRGIEQYAMNKIFEYARLNELRWVTGRYIPTAKNAMVRDFYQQFGFQRVEDDHGEGTTWRLAVDRYRPQRHFLHEPPASSS